MCSTTFPQPSLIGGHGYPVETHKVVTKDGYILRMHRIPYGRNSRQSGRRSAVYIQHGLLSSSADWVIAGPKKSLGIISNFHKSRKYVYVPV